MKRSYQRHLPHEIPEGVPIFVSWNLKGALPAQVLTMLHREKNRLTVEPARIGESPHERKTCEGKILFGLADRYLDEARSGPMHLKDGRAAKIFEDSILFGVLERYELFAWCVMANHVHLFVKPVIEFKYLMQRIKGFTAHKINGALGTRGDTFWQDESYDHWPRDEEEMLRIIHYIEQNPVKAGLCARPEEWRWSSARFRENWPAGEPDGLVCFPRE